ncbi:MAG: DUF1800 domain-containing protein [Dehalococcoidia bacterium]|nr:DUF1800 domain-containing protein [Dehalococcoidia bacterium]
MDDRDLELMAHLARRAGFGATRGELERNLAQGYEATVEELLNPGDPRNMPDDLIRRYHVDQSEARMLASTGATWIYRMVTTRCPLEEKMALFWHGLFATGYTKLNQARTLLNQVDMFRRCGLGKFPDLLVELSKDPAMIIWLDNQDNHKDAINENYGRELLELFSMGIGNYTEQDIKECSRAFTGWTLKNAEFMAMRASKDSIWPYGRIAWHFEYRDHDHDHGEKTFLGETGKFNGEDIIDIIVRQEATAEFVCRRLFQYFASDEVDNQGRETITRMKASYFDSGYEIRPVLRTLFNSDYFKSDRARYSRVKGPVELLVGAIRMAGSYQKPTFGAQKLADQALYMGQGLLQPPTVEGWHEGMEWIDSGSLVERVNFAAKELADVRNPGVRSIIDRLAGDGEGVLSPEKLVDRCLDLMGPISVSEGTASSLVALAERDGELDLREHQEGDDAERRVGNMLRLIASTKEYQLA